MKTPFFKRQSTWACILLTGLVIIAFFIVKSSRHYKDDPYTPLINSVATADTATRVVPDFNLGFEKITDVYFRVDNNVTIGFRKLSTRSINYFSVEFVDTYLDRNEALIPKTIPDGWYNTVWSPVYESKIDSTEKYSGNYSLLIEPKGEIKNHEFGGPVCHIPAEYIGKEITVSAYMKTENVDQPIGLLVRINEAANVLEFDNMIQKGIKGSEIWEKYTVSLPLPEVAETITIGAILSGKGKLWVDDFEVLIDGKSLSEAKRKAPKKYKADTDTEFDNGSKIQIRTYTPQTVANLELLGRIWGFLKYYHPAIATGEYNWDAELFRIMPSVINAQNNEERNQIFIKWIDRLGKIKPAKYQDIDEHEVKLYPDLAWIEKPDLGKTLSKKLNAIKNAERSLDNYYITLYPEVLFPIFKNEKGYEKMSFSYDSGMKLLALFRYWNTIQYFCPYRNLTDWNTVLGEFIPKFIDGVGKPDYDLTLMQLMDRTGITNSYIFDSKVIYEQRKKSYYPPYQVSFIEGKAVVTDIMSNKLINATELKIGDIITHINNQPVEDIVDEMRHNLPTTSMPVLLQTITGELLLTDTEKLSLKIIRNGKPVSSEITCYPQIDIDVALFVKMRSPKDSYNLLSSDIGYIYPGTLKDDMLPSVMNTFKNTKGIIIDLRYIPGIDFTASALGAYLVPQPVDYANTTNGSIIQPGMFTYGKTLKVGEENRTDYYKGKIVIIINELTRGHAVPYAMAFKTAPKATIIGSATAVDNGGHFSTIKLPGSTQNLLFPSVGIYYPDVRDAQNTSIVPDIEILPTIQGIIEGRDELVEKAIEIITKQ